MVLAAAVTATSRRMVGREVLDALGPDGYLVNIARGTLIDQAALVTACRSGASPVRRWTSTTMNRMFPTRCARCPTSC